jgi:hypothetical protein
MKCANKLASWALVLILIIGIPFPVAAALRDYTRGQFTLTGTLGVRFDGRRSESPGSSTSEQGLSTELSANTGGFVWDPRFLLFKAGVRLNNSMTSGDEGDSSSDLIGFRLGTTLFPRWRYPYLPIRLNVDKSRTTVEARDKDTYDLDRTTFGINWGLFREPFGHIDLSYLLRTHQSTGETSEQDETDHEFMAEGRRKFREAQWGASEVDYGYNFNRSENRVNSTIFTQHDVYARDRSKLGEKMDLNANAVFYHRENESATITTASSLISTGANLSVRQTPRFSHNYSLSSVMMDNDGQSSSRYTGAARLTYQYPFNEYWNGRATAGLRTSLSQSDSGNTNRTDVSTAGALRYMRKHGVFQVSGGYALSLAQSMGADNSQATMAHSGDIGYARRDNPLYADDLRLQVRFVQSDDPTQDYSLHYGVNSRLTLRDTLNSAVEYSMHMADENDTSYFKAGTQWDHRLSRTSRAGLNATYQLNMRDQGDRTRMSVDGRYSTRLFQRNNLAFNGSLRWEQLTDETSKEETAIIGMADLGYRFGKWTAALRYNYRSREVESGESIDQRIMVQVRRFYGMRY